MAWNRLEIVTASFAAGGPAVAFDPIRVQKLLFLVDREVSGRIGGPYFDFRPYRYGPFDAAVYRVLGELERTGHVWINVSGRYHRYLLTDSGERRGLSVLDHLPDPVETYMRKAARWVRLTPYRRMLSAIYRRYPETAINSVVGHLGPPGHKEAQSPFVRGMARAFDVAGTSNRTSDSRKPARSDEDAIHDAWRTVGEELEDAMTRFGRTEHLW
ncbi:MAG: hypothetical protein OXN89_14315 [Bryobacterales bacterium]|nr:hypothetical protein [Bryobacterales bacterium]